MGASSPLRTNCYLLSVSSSLFRGNTCNPISPHPYGRKDRRQYSRSLLRESMSLLRDLIASKLEASCHLSHHTTPESARRNINGSAAASLPLVCLSRRNKHSLLCPPTISTQTVASIRIESRWTAQGQGGGTLVVPQGCQTPLKLQA
jgi:hypothetical protein